MPKKLQQPAKNYDLANITDKILTHWGEWLSGLRRHSRTVGRAPGEHADPLIADLLADERAERVDKLLRRAAPVDYYIATLRWAQGMTWTEVAVNVGLTATTARQRGQRLRETLDALSQKQ